MDSITVKRPVTIKVIVTQEYKNKLIFELQEKMGRVENEINYLEFQSKRMINELEKQNPQAILAARQHFETKQKKNHENKMLLLARIKETEKLSIGSEVFHSLIDSVTEIKIGDNWQDILGVEILVQDEEIVEIRGKI